MSLHAIFYMDWIMGVDFLINRGLIVRARQYGKAHRWINGTSTDFNAFSYDI